MATAAILVVCENVFAMNTTIHEVVGMDLPAGFLNASAKILVKWSTSLRKMLSRLSPRLITPVHRRRRRRMSGILHSQLSWHRPLWNAAYAASTPKQNELCHGLTPANELRFLLREPITPSSGLTESSRNKNRVELNPTHDWLSAI